MASLPQPLSSPTQLERLAPLAGPGPRRCAPRPSDRRSQRQPIPPPPRGYICVGYRRPREAPRGSRPRQHVIIGRRTNNREEHESAQHLARDRPDCGRSQMSARADFALAAAGLERGVQAPRSCRRASRRNRPLASRAPLVTQARLRSAASRRRGRWPPACCRLARRSTGA